MGLLMLINWIECDRSNFAAIAPVVYYKAKGTESDISISPDELPTSTNQPYFPIGCYKNDRT